MHPVWLIPTWVLLLPFRSKVIKKAPVFYFLISTSYSRLATFDSSTFPSPHYCSSFSPLFHVSSLLLSYFAYVVFTLFPIFYISSRASPEGVFGVKVFLWTIPVPLLFFPITCFDSNIFYMAHFITLLLPPNSWGCWLIRAFHSLYPLVFYFSFPQSTWLQNSMNIFLKWLFDSVKIYYTVRLVDGLPEGI